jgi:protein-S-isoprenylcysteine O-methyltransferase Ste14
MGTTISGWAIKTLSLHQSHGLKGKLVLTGPYKYTRNPQYIGIIFLIIGALFLFNSLLFLINGTLGIIIFLILPFAEEPWLEKQYGEKYNEYKKKVRRFL